MPHFRSDQCPQSVLEKIYDFIVIGSGVAGPRFACDAVQKQASCLLIEAGKYFSKETYPQKEIDANAQLYWGGGVELNHRADIGLLRPKVVGGGTIVNQALLDRFDDDALDQWRQVSGVKFFSREAMDHWYEQAEKRIIHQKVPAEYKNGNAKIFQEGFEKNNYKYDLLTRAQSNCHFEQGNDCIECLSGCRIDSKQSTAVTSIRKGLEMGMDLLSEFEVVEICNDGQMVTVKGLDRFKRAYSFRCRQLILAAGAIGNSKILLNSQYQKKLPALGKNFFTHPQSMCLAIYDKEINAHKGPLQSFKSADPNFRKNGFKLENVFAPPVAIAMLVPGFGQEHLTRMKKLKNMACIEVAVRDTQPGEIRWKKWNQVQVIKEYNTEDRLREKKGLEAIYNIFRQTGAKEIIRGTFTIGLHLMGGCGIGVDGEKSVVNPDFQLHSDKNIFVFDSSIFPNAPGINPSLTIMALAHQATEAILKIS